MQDRLEAMQTVLNSLSVGDAAKSHLQEAVIAECITEDLETKNPRFLFLARSVKSVYDCALDRSVTDRNVGLAVDILERNIKAVDSADAKIIGGLTLGTKGENPPETALAASRHFTPENREALQQIYAVTSRLTTELREISRSQHYSLG